MSAGRDSAKYVGGYLNPATARLFLADQDGTEIPQPVLIIPGTLVDHEDGTYDIIPTEG